MTNRPGESDPTLLAPRSLQDVWQEAGELATRITLFAEGLGEDSQSAMAEANPALVGSDMEEEWPLNAAGLRNLFNGIAESKLKGFEADQTNPVSVAGLERVKYSPDTFETVYGESESPRLAFAADLIKWANALSDRERKVLLMIDLGEDEGSRVELSVFEDVEIARTYLQSFADGSLLDPEEIAEGAEPYVWIGDKTVVQGTSEQIATLKADLQLE